MANLFLPKIISWFRLDEHVRHLSKRVDELEINFSENEITLGETNLTAYRGDRGKTAYDHSQTLGNPHSVTKNDIGLENVNNTSDLDKPISIIQQSALALKADKTYVDNLALGLLWQNPVEIVNVIGNSNTPIIGNELDCYIIDTGGNTGIWSSFNPGDLIQKQSGVWVFIKALQIGDRLGCNFKNTSTPINSFLGQRNSLVQITGGTSGSFTYTFTVPLNNYAVFVLNSNAFLHNVAFTYSNELLMWVQMSASTNRIFDNNFDINGNLITLNPINSKTTLNLDNVDNTSDINKPISTVQQSALSLKEDSSNKSTSASESSSNVKFPVWSAIISYFDLDKIKSILGITTLSGNNTGDETITSIQTKRPLKTIEGQSLEGVGNINLEKSDIGLSNVDNTSDLNKPISTSTQTALDNKANTTHTHIISDVTNLQTSLNAKQDTLISGTNIKTINGVSILGSGDLLTQTTFTLTSNFASTVVTRANVTGMSFNVTAGKKYRIEILGDYQTASLTTGGSIGFVLTSGVGTIKGVCALAIGQAGSNANNFNTNIRAINAVNTTVGSFLTSTGVTVINSPHYIDADLIFDCTTSGVFQLQWASEVAGISAQINAGTVMIVTPLN